MAVENLTVVTDDDWFSQYAIRQPPQLSPEQLDPFASAARAEITRLKALKPGEADPETHRHYMEVWRSDDPLMGGWVERPPVAEREQIRLVLAQAWVSYVGEAYACREGCAPWQGDADAYINRLVKQAAQDIHGFLVFGVPVWRPKMWHPQSGRLHQAVERVIHLRIQARGGGCELCHAPGRIGVPLELHHLHYRSFGREVPSDVMRLCRQCHDKRHAISGYPRDTRWQDSIRWTEGAA